MSGKSYWKLIFVQQLLFISLGLILYCGETLYGNCHQLLYDNHIMVTYRTAYYNLHILLANAIYKLRPSTNLIKLLLLHAACREALLVKHVRPQSIAVTVGQPTHLCIATTIQCVNCPVWNFLYSVSRQQKLGIKFTNSGVCLKANFQLLFSDTRQSDQARLLAHVACFCLISPMSPLDAKHPSCTHLKSGKYWLAGVQLVLLASFYCNNIQMPSQITLIFFQYSRYCVPGL